MNNPIKRLFKPQFPSRFINLNASSDRLPPPSATCEVIEFDSATGMEQWNDSVFIQDFEDSTLSAPASLFEPLRAAAQTAELLDMSALFFSRRKKSM